MLFVTSMADISKMFGKKVRKIGLRKGFLQGKPTQLLDVYPTCINGIEFDVRNMSLKNIE